MRKAFYFCVLFKALFIVFLSLSVSLGMEAKFDEKVVNEDSVDDFEYIELSQYGFKETSKISRLIDSILLYDKHPYMVLLQADNTLTNTVLIKCCPVTRDMQKSICGIYRSSNGKYLLIVGINDDCLKQYSIEKTADLFRVNKSVISCPKYTSYSLGYKLYLSINNDSSINAKIAFNGGDLFNDPQTAHNFSWFSGSIDSILSASQVEHQHYQRYDSALYVAKSKGNGIDSYLNDKRDTIYSTTNYFLKQQLYDSVCSLHVYEFEKSSDGQFLRRLCDSINANNIFNQLCIEPTINTSNKKEIYLSFNILSSIESNSLNGVILSDRSSELKYLHGFTDDMLQEFGIVKSNRTIPVKFRSDIILFGIDAIGYKVWVHRDSNACYSVNMKFGSRYLDSKRSKPFEWLLTGMSVPVNEAPRSVD